MFKKLINYIFLFIITFSITFSPVVYSADLRKPGYVLTEESMVFTIPEADKLRKRIEELELKEIKLLHTDELVAVQKAQITTLEDLLEIEDKKNTEYHNLTQLHQDRIKKLERQEKLNKIENIGLIILGAVFAGGAIYLGDKIGDSMENN